MTYYVKCQKEKDLLRLKNSNRLFIENTRHPKFLF